MSEGEGRAGAGREPRDAAAVVGAPDCFDLLGGLVAVEATPAEARDAVRSVLRGFGPLAADPAAAVARYALANSLFGWQARNGDAIVHTDDDFLATLNALEWHIVTDALARRDDLFHLHGAALCLPTRRAGVIIVGDSGVGKTTLTLGLMLRGFVPFGDDVILLDPDTFTIHPFRRAFHVAPHTWELLQPLATGPVYGDDDMPSGYFAPPQWAERAVPLRWALFPERRAGGPPELTPLTPAEAATALLAQTTSLARAPRPTLAFVTRLVARVACYRCRTGDLAASVAMIQHLVAEGRPSGGAAPGTPR